MNPTVAAASMLAGLMLTLAADTSAAEPRYGVCREQIADHVRQRLGQTLERIEINGYAERTTIVDPGDALVYVKECDGFHAYEIYGTESVCENLPHYGTGGVYVRYGGAYEGCRVER